MIARLPQLQFAKQQLPKLAVELRSLAQEKRDEKAQKEFVDYRAEKAPLSPEVRYTASFYSPRRRRAVPCASMACRGDGVAAKPDLALHHIDTDEKPPVRHRSVAPARRAPPRHRRDARRRRRPVVHTGAHEDVRGARRGEGREENQELEGQPRERDHAGEQRKKVEEGKATGGEGKCRCGNGSSSGSSISTEESQKPVVLFWTCTVAALDSSLIDLDIHPPRRGHSFQGVETEVTSE